MLIERQLGAPDEIEEVVDTLRLRLCVTRASAARRLQSCVRGRSAKSTSRASAGGSMSAGTVSSVRRVRARSPAADPGHREHCGVTTFVFRLIAPRASFAQDMTNEEREIMDRHAAYWQPYREERTDGDLRAGDRRQRSWGLGVVQAEDEAEVRSFAAGDPFVTSGTGDHRVRNADTRVRPSRGDRT